MLNIKIRYIFTVFLSCIAITTTKPMCQPQLTIDQLPSEILGEIFKHIEGTNILLHKLARAKELPDHLYDKIVEHFIDKAVPYFPNYNDIPTLIEQYFSVTAQQSLDISLFQKKIRKALTKYIKTYPFNTWKQFLDSNQPNTVFPQTLNHTLLQEQPMLMLENSQFKSTLRVLTVTQKQQLLTAIGKYQKLLKKSCSYIKTQKKNQLFINQKTTEAIQTTKIGLESLNRASLGQVFVITLLCLWCLFPFDLFYNDRICTILADYSQGIAYFYPILFFLYSCSSYALIIYLNTSYFLGTIDRLSSYNDTRTHNLFALIKTLQQTLSRLNDMHDQLITSQ